MKKCFITNLLAIIFGPIVECCAQLPYDKFCESLQQHDLYETEYIIDGSVRAYYKQYYQMPENYDDLLLLFPEDLTTLCDSLFYKNRQQITFIPNPDSSALLYSGKIVMGLYSQYTCKTMLSTPVSMGVHMVDTLGHSCYDDSIVFVIKKLVLPTVYSEARYTNCKKYYMSFASNTIPCSIPYLYDVENKHLSVAEDCRRNDITICGEFDSILEAELGKYEFRGIRLITIPVNLYLEK